MGADPRARSFVRMGRRVLESASGYIAQGLLISRRYFGARSISRAIISGLGGPDGPSNMTTGSPISVQRFSNPTGVQNHQCLSWSCADVLGKVGFSTVAR